jgi:hypothetical protein
MTLGEAWPMIVVAAGALIGYGELKSKVSALSHDLNAGLATRASREVTEANYREIIARLDRIERRMDDAAHGRPT